MKWQPIETAPFNQAVEVRAGSRKFAAILKPDASLNSAGEPCDQWVAVNDGDHPRDWSEGACWESNADEQMSTQPTHWRAMEEG